MMSQVYSFQHSDHFEVQVGQVSMQGKGRWVDIPLSERREMVRKLILENLKLQCAWEGDGNGLHKD
jgi:hypothetical protein